MRHRAEVFTCAAAAVSGTPVSCSLHLQPWPWPRQAHAYARGHGSTRQHTAAHGSMRRTSMRHHPLVDCTSNTPSPPPVPMTHRSLSALPRTNTEHATATAAPMRGTARRSLVLIHFSALPWALALGSMSGSQCVDRWGRRGRRYFHLYFSVYGWL